MMLPNKMATSRQQNVNSVLSKNDSLQKYVIFQRVRWWSQAGSNRRPQHCQKVALSR